MGVFPNDKWDITIYLQTDFNVTFDRHEKFCLTPSPNYYGNYTTIPISGNQDYAVNLELSHPKSFPAFVDKVFLFPIKLLGVLWVVCILIAIVVAIVRREILGSFFSTFVAICSAIIVFIPVFQLSTQELKTPLELTIYDTYFLILLSMYVLFLVGILIAKIFLTKGLNQEKPTNVKID